MPTYTIKAAIHGVSPMIWRRITIDDNTSLGALHFILQFSFGWDNEYLHSFHIYGNDYGINYDGGIGFTDNPWLLPINTFKFEIRDRFTYEYNFYQHWLLDIRIEHIDKQSKKKTPFCISGNGIPGVTKYDESESALNLLEAIAQADDKTMVGDFREFIEAFNHVRFNRHQLNKKLTHYDFSIPDWSQGL